MTYITGKKERIVELLRDEESALTLEEICTRLLSDGHGKSTVYRLVSELTREGIVRRLADAKTRRVTYQCVKSSCADHLHLRCLACGSLVHLDASLSHELERSLLLSSGFALDDGAMLVGKCRDCRDAGGVKI